MTERISALRSSPFRGVGSLLALFMAFSLLAGCVFPPKNTDSATEGTSLATAATTTFTSSFGPTSTGIESTGGESTGVVSTGGECDPNVEELCCDLLDDSCLDGSKCVPYIFEGPFWDRTKCIPVSPDSKGQGEICLVEDWKTEVDDCERGSMCFHNRCRPFCDIYDPSSCAPASECVFLNPLVSLCIAWCNPLALDCPNGASCAFVGYGWTCGVGGGLGLGFMDPCMYADACAPGLACADAGFFDTCPGEGCCTQYCETDLPDVDDGQNGGKCPDPKMVCRDWFLKDAPEGFDRLGICAIP